MGKYAVFNEKLPQKKLSLNGKTLLKNEDQIFKTEIIQKK